MERKTISWEFFSGIAVTLLLGLALMCGIQTYLSSVYFARERRVALTSVLDGAALLTERFADEGTVVTQPDTDAALMQNARDRYALFETVSGAVVVVAEPGGGILLHTGADDAFTGRALPAAALAVMQTGDDLFEHGDLSGVFARNYYIAGRAVKMNGVDGYLIVASPMDALTDYLQESFSIFVLSAVLMLLFSGLLTLVLTRRVTAPIEAISHAARRLGGGDFTARAPENGSAELAEFAATFNNMASRLQTIDNARGQFMGNIAHELRTPMTSIKGFIDGMRDGTIPPEDNARYLDIVSQEAGRLTRLVQNMLDITRLEAGEMPIRAREYDLWQSVNGVVLADERRIEDGKLDIEGLGLPPLTVYADPDLVQQVVYNLVDNAIKFTPPGGVIRFAAQKQDGFVALSVENTGAGIAADALPHVFERFYKEDSSRGLNTRGAGLGLHICKVLVNLQGGSIRVESQEGEWTRFVFTLPTAAPAPAETPPPNETRRRKRRRLGS